MATWFENMQNLARNPPPKAPTPTLIQRSQPSSGLNIGPVTIDPSLAERTRETQTTRIERSSLQPGIRTENTFFYPFYETAHNVADWYGDNVLKNFDQVAQYYPRNAPGAFNFFGGYGVLTGVKSGIETIGMIPSGSEMLIRESVKNPAAVPQYAAAGLSMQGRGIFEGFKSNPAKTIGEIAGTSLLFYGAGKGIGFVTKPAAVPLRFKMTEYNIGRQIPTEHLVNMRAVSTIGRNVKGLKSNILRDPNLSQVERIGSNHGAAITKILSQQEHSIYGSATRLGQMPLKAQPRAVHDIDVFVPDVSAFNLKAIDVLGPKFKIEGNTIVKLPGGHAIDTHIIPPNYPLKGTGIKIEYHASDIAPPLPFDFMPKQLLKGKLLTQEHLFTQAQRKAASVMGTPASGKVWKFGPEAHRMKDVTDLLYDTEYLIKANKGTYNPIKHYKMFRLNRALNTLKTSESFKDLIKAGQLQNNILKTTRREAGLTIRVSHPKISTPKVPKSIAKYTIPTTAPSPYTIPSRPKSTSVPKYVIPSLPKSTPSNPKLPSTPRSPLRYKPPSTPGYNPPSRVRPPRIPPTYLIPSQPQSPPSTPTIIIPQRYKPPTPPPIMRRQESTTLNQKPKKDPHKHKKTSGINSRGWHIKNPVPNLKLVFGKTPKIKMPRIKL